MPAAGVGSGPDPSPASGRSGGRAAHSSLQDFAGDGSALAPLACRVQGSVPGSGPYIRLTIAGKEYVGLVDTGATLSLIGDVLYGDCRGRNVRVRKVNVPLRLASGVTNAKGAVRLSLRYSGGRCRQRFVYLPGLTIPIILGRDFIAREGLTLDLKANGYRCGGPLSTLIPFAVPSQAGSISSRAVTQSCELNSGDAVLTVANVPQVIERVVASFGGGEAERAKLLDTLLPFSGMFTEKPGTTDVLEHQIDTGMSRPWRCNPRPLSARKRVLLDAALGEMVATGAVRRWRKAHGLFQWCWHLRKMGRRGCAWIIAS